MMSVSDFSKFWDVAARVGGDEFIVRRTMEQLDTHQISLREAIDILQSYLADRIDATGSISADRLE